MTISDQTLALVSEFVRIELTEYLSEAFVISEVTSEFLPDAEGNEYIRTTVTFEDNHPKLDGHTLNMFTSHITPLCAERGFDRPVVTYTNRSGILV